MRARLAIAVAGIPIELREIQLRDKPAEFLAASEKGTVPVLKCTDGPTLAESRDIMVWALHQNDPQDWLAPWHADPALVAAFLDSLEGPFKRHLDRYKYASRYDQDEALLHREAGAAFLSNYNDTLGKQPALSGACAGILDYASLPFVRQFRIADPTWFDAQPWPNLHRWLQAFLESEMFAAIMTKYPVWQSGETGVSFPNSGVLHVQ